MNTTLLWLIPALPFLGFVLNGTLGRRLSRAGVASVALLFTFLPAVLVAMLWTAMLRADAPLAFTVTSRPWIAITGFQVNFSFAVDHLTLIMLAIITGVGFLIHIYSVSYMAHDEGYWRFFAYLNLFMFFMLLLVLSANFLLLFVGWEGVGLASYLLIGFYFPRDSAANAGKKAFVVNRVGDFGFLLGMFLLIAHFGTLDFAGVFAQVNALPPAAAGGFLTAICLLLVLGATGKSAQIPLYVWLPDAMEGPTPVSALIHAATMVTAGIYLIARCHALFDRSPYTLGVIALIGAFTAFFAATVATVQHDIKRVLAYSTISQLGFMFLACGVTAYTAGVFHLMTHAFFKALLFLAAGFVIHALSGEQDMRVMGGLRRRIPVTFWTMSAGVFAIAGIWPFSGFFSKDEILYRTFTSPNPLAKLLWFIALVTAGLTSFYMFRLWFKTFFGVERFDENALAHGHSSHPLPDAPGTQATFHQAAAAEHDSGQAPATPAGLHTGVEPTRAHGVHESPAVMIVPLAILALLAVVGGWIGVPAALGGSNHFEHFLQPVFLAATRTEIAPDAVSHTTEIVLAAVSLLTALLGLAIAYLFYFRQPGTASRLANAAKPLYSLLEGKYWVDQAYGLGIMCLLAFSRLGLGGFVEGGLVQGAGSGLAAGTEGLGWLTRRMQTGNIRAYAGWLALGAAAIIAVVLFGVHPSHP